MARQSGKMKANGVTYRRHVLRGLAASVAAAPLGACGAAERLAPLPTKLRSTASFQGLPANTRLVLDSTDDDRLARVAVTALRRELDYAGRTGVKDLPPAVYLAISGGGENGAYGAGILTAWSEVGTRPEFKAVTGVSTGALIAPFAFLGPDRDKELERFYTTIDKSQVMVSRGLISGVLGDSLYDSGPLLRLIRSVLTPDFVAAIGKEYSEKGRLLFVATTNLDVPVGVLWNIGAIAAGGNKDAPELIAKILLASASIPGALPPVMIDVEAGGQRYQEMHVDGGTVAQVVLYPPSFSGDDLKEAVGPNGMRLLQTVAHRERELYVIRNSRPGPDFETVDRSTLKIAGRAVSTLISTQGIGDLYQLYLVCQRDHIDYNVTYIPNSFSEKITAPFDRGYMNRLYRVGREQMLAGKAWSKYPPGYNPTPFSQLKTVAPR
jgi:predicted acylesterase/phospholipase RssA